MRDIDKEIGDQYNDFDDLLKRKREEEKMLQDKTLSVRAKLKDRIKFGQGRLGKFADGENMQKSQVEQFTVSIEQVQRYEKELNILTTAFERERRRQRLLMDEKRGKMQRLKDKKEKMKRMV